jgi:hypothetical protein
MSSLTRDVAIIGVIAFPGIETDKLHTAQFGG